MTIWVLSQPDRNNCDIRFKMSSNRSSLMFAAIANAYVARELVGTLGDGAC